MLRGSCEKGFEMLPGSWPMVVRPMPRGVWGPPLSFQGRANPRDAPSLRCSSCCPPRHRCLPGHDGQETPEDEPRGKNVSPPPAPFRGDRKVKVPSSGPSPPDAPAEPEQHTRERRVAHGRATPRGGARHLLECKHCRCSADVVTVPTNATCLPISDLHFQLSTCICRLKQTARGTNAVK